MKPRVNYRLIIFILLPIIIISIIAFIIYKTNLATIIIQVAPNNAVVSINNKTYQNGIFSLMSKTDAEITISADGFQPKTFMINLNKREVTSIIAYLVPNDNDWSYYEKEENRESLAILLSSSGYTTWDYTKSEANLTLDQSTIADDFLNQLSIKSVTPIDFSICGEPATRSNCDAISVTYDYYSECDNRLCLEISGRKPNLETTTLELVKNKLLEYNYNLENYQYFYQQRDN